MSARSLLRRRAIATYMYTSGSNPAVDITALVTAMGVTVNAFFDCRTGIVLQPGFATVNSWNDVSGHSLVAQQTTQAKQPLIGTDGSIQFSGTGSQNLFIAANALFNIGGSYSLIVVGRFLSPGTGTPYIVSIGDAVNEFLGINNGGAGAQLWTGKGGKTIVTTASTVPTTNYSQNRVACVTISGTTPLGFQVPNQSQSTVAIGVANTSASAVFTIGGFNGGSGSGNVAVRAVICLPSVISSTNLTKVLTWAQQYHAAYAA